MNQFQRGNTLKASIELKASNVFADVLGNNMNVNIYKPDGTYLISGATADRTNVGRYEYYFNTQDSNPLGIYVIEWKGIQPLGGAEVLPLVKRSIIQLVETIE